MSEAFIWEWLGIYVLAASRKDAIAFICDARCDDPSTKDGCYDLNDLADGREGGDHERAGDYMRLVPNSEVIELWGNACVTLEDVMALEFRRSGSVVGDRDVDVVIKITAACLRGMLGDHCGIFYEEER